MLPDTAQSFRGTLYIHVCEEEEEIEHTNVKRGTSGDIVFKYSTYTKLFQILLSSPSKRLFTI